MSRLRDLSPAERALLLQAACLLPLIDLGLRLVSFSRLHSVLLRTARGRGRRPALEPTAIAKLVNIAARRGAWRVGCLRESMTLWWLLRRGGIDGNLRVGVRGRQDDLEAHAWVELDGRPLNDRRDVRALYATFPRDLAAPSSEPS